MTQLVTLILLFTTCSFGLADEKSAHAMHEADVFVDGTAIDEDPDKIKRFIADLQGGQVAVVSVVGMVCDFCARGIEKTLKRDKSVTKVDVDLSKGKVLIAFASTAPIDLEAIDRKILANGQNVTAVKILSI